jgi:hypothetical protein
MEGREEVEDEETSGTPFNIKNRRKWVKLFRKIDVWSIRMIAWMVNMDKEMVRQILHDQLNMRKVCVKMAPKNLTQEQKDNRKTFALSSWNESQNNRKCLKMSSYVMNVDF